MGGVGKTLMKPFSFNNSNSNVNYSQTNAMNRAPQGVSNGLRMISKKESNDTVVAIIVSFTAGSSYDNLFTTVEQKAMEGTRVLVYGCDSNYIVNLYKAFKGDPQDEEAKQLMRYVKEVDPDCIVFNWECSSNYSGKSFIEGPQNLFMFLRLIIDRGHFAMFSDFSLKALINQWSEKELGPNPFKQVNEHSGLFQIRFKCEELRSCPSAQLQIVGDMAEKGRMNVTAAGGTIVYTVDQTKLKHEQYELKVLTVAQFQGYEEHLRCRIGEDTGTAGHVLLKYPKGGSILTSMGHWVELMKIDTSQNKLFEVAAREYGANQAFRMKAEYDQLDVAQQSAYIESNAMNFVKNQAPCSNMNRKARS